MRPGFLPLKKRRDSLSRWRGRIVKRSRTWLSLALLVLCAAPLACGKPAGPQGEPAGKAPASIERPPDEIKWVFISLAGKGASETSVLPLLRYGSYIVAIPGPPITANDYDERQAYRATAVKMVEQKNAMFLNALKRAVEGVGPARQWQENYEVFVRMGREPGGFIEQLEKARATGETCPPAACGAGAPKPEGCPHTHVAHSTWAPDGSFTGAARSPLADYEEGELDVVLVCFDCAHPH